MAATDYEKLGVFYLGKEYDLAAGARRPGLVLYDSKDLVTHAVCVGMTGSGKTGLGIGLIEEAALDGVPVLAIDPKGDLANLLLTFPDLAPGDFAPWVDPSDASRHSLTPEAFAAQQAELWKNGLAEWDEDGARIARLRAAADFRLYTPGSRAGVPLALLNSLSAPPDENPDDARTRITTTASSLLALAGLTDVAPHSREQALIAAILSRQPRVFRPASDRRPSLAGRRDSEAAVRQDRRARPRDLLPGQGSPGPGAALQQRAGDARIRRVARRRPARRRLHAATRPRASRASPSCRLPISATPSGCWWCRCSSAPCSTGRGSRAAPARCARCSTWTRCSATCRRWPTRRPRRRCSRCSSRRGRLAWAWCWPRRTPSISITRRCRTPAPGSWASCRPSATRRACSTASKA